MNKHDDSFLSYRIEETLKQEDAPTPHVLAELSETEVLRFAANTIHLKGVSTNSTTQNELLYKSITYGSNIRRRKSIVTFQGKKIPSYELSIQSTKRNMCIITLEKDDAERVFPYLITSNSTHNNDPSGRVVLMTCIFRQPPKTSKTWNKEDFVLIKKCKPNILQSSNHHQSTGYYASFGNKGSYEMQNQSSVGQYATKKNTKLEKQRIINSNATIYENYCADEISRSVNTMKGFLPNIKRIIAPVIETSYEIQLRHKDMNLKETPSISNGCWQTSICINAETKEYHTEHDCTYTLISVPNHSVPKPSLSSSKYDFLFRLTDNQSINITLKPGISLMFSGLFLTHRQNKSNDTTDTENNFFNIASYGNQRLFNHIRKTYNRNK